MDAIDTAARGLAWPPTREDEDRLRQYETYTQLYLGRHQEVFDPYRRPDAGPYVTANLLGAISRLMAHRLVGEAPKARAKAGSQVLLDFLCQANRWPSLCYAGALGGSYRGDTVFRVRYEADRDVVVMEEVPPAIYFPHVAPDHPMTVQAVSLAWRVPAAASSELRVAGWAARRELDARDSEPRTGIVFLREEYHEPGLIENRLWKLVRTPGEPRYYRRQVPLGALAETADLPEIVETGLDEIPVVHIANRRLAETGLWGLSDYADLVSLQEAINRRRTQAGHILDKHADPLLAIDESFLDAQGRLPMDRVRAVPLVQDAPAPQYVTWDGKLTDSHAEADELVRMILLVAGVSPESFGFGTGGFPESGLAIRLRQMLTTSTVAGKRLQWEPGLRQLLSLATKMHARHVTGGPVSGVRPLEPDEIGIEFGDGLPADFSASIKDEVALQGAGLASKEASLRRLFPDWTDAEIEAEVRRLGKEGKE